jgi:hypothetical protein
MATNWSQEKHDNSTQVQRKAELPTTAYLQVPGPDPRHVQKSDLAAELLSNVGTAWHKRWLIGLAAMLALAGTGILSSSTVRALVFSVSP